MQKGYEVFVPSLDDREVHRKVRDWLIDRSTYNNKQLAMLVLLHNKADLEYQLVLVDLDGKTPVLCVRDSAGILHTGDYATSIYMQSVHGSVNDYLPILTVSPTILNTVKRWMSSWVDSKKWAEIQDEAVAAFWQLRIKYKQVPYLERVFSPDLVDNRRYIGVGNGVLDIQENRILTKEDYPGVYVFEQTGWDWTPDLWKTHHEGVDIWLPMAYLQNEPIGEDWQDLQRLAWRQLAYAFWKKLPKQFIAMLTEGDAGKSTMLSLLAAAFPKEVGFLEADALKRGMGQNPHNPEILKLGKYRLVGIEEPGLCDSNAIRRNTDADEITGRHEYGKRQTLINKGTMVFMGNPDPGVDILGTGDLTEASEATAKRGRFIPMLPVPKEYQVDRRVWIRNAEFIQIFGARFLELVRRVSETGDPGETPEMVQYKQEQREQSQKPYVREIFPKLLTKDTDGNFTFTEAYTAMRLFAKEDNMQERYLPPQAEFSRKLAEYYKIPRSNRVGFRKQNTRVLNDYGTVETSKRHAVTRVDGYRLSDLAEEIITHYAEDSEFPD